MTHQGDPESKDNMAKQQAEEPATIETNMRQLAIATQEPVAKQHKFWSTQPVPQYGEHAAEIGPIEPLKPVHEIAQDPPALPKEFAWCQLDITDEKELKELYELLMLNYVEDSEAHVRFDYSADFLKWALQPPNWKGPGMWACVLQPIIALSRLTRPMAEINLLCVHKKLRSKRLTPLLIREITRQSHLQGIFQAAYTGGVVLPKPVATCRYFHRSLNPKKLVECGFSVMRPKWTMARMLRYYNITNVTPISGLRMMQENDVPQVRILLNTYLTRFDLAPYFETDADVAHWILPHKNVVWSYVVENLSEKITDMFSFYALPSSVIGNAKHKSLNAAYMFYYAVDIPDHFKENQEKEADYMKTRLQDLIQHALFLAKEKGFDVMNTLDLMDNALFVNDLKFSPGTGYLN